MIKYFCDSCDEEIIETYAKQEMHSIAFTGGYGSLFGDGTRFELQLCDKCMYRLLSSANLVEKGTKGNHWD